MGQAIARPAVTVVEETQCLPVTTAVLEMSVRNTVLLIGDTWI